MYIQFNLICTACDTTRNKFYNCTYVHLHLFHSKLSNIQHPLDRDPPRMNMDQGQRPLEGTWDQAARQEVTSYRDPPSPVGYFLKNYI